MAIRFNRLNLYSVPALLSLSMSRSPLGIDILAVQIQNDMNRNCPGDDPGETN
jgi:hypothetical protein